MSDSVWPHRWQPTRLLCAWDTPGKNNGVGCHFILQFMHAYMLSLFTHVWLCTMLWTAAHKAPPSTGFSRQESWSGLPLPSPEKYKPILLFFGTLHSDAYIFPFLLCFSLLFFLQLFVRPPQTAILLFFISFPWGWSWSLSPVQCHKPPSIVHQTLYLSEIYFSLPLYNHKGFDLGHTWMV